MKTPKKNTIIEIIALLYVCLFLYTAISKLTDYDVTREQMTAIPILAPFAHIIVWLLPAIETGIAILLFIPYTRIRGLYASTGLMFLFTLYIVYILLFYPELPCTCGGLLAAMTWPVHLLFNIVFILLSFAAMRLHKGSKIQSGIPAK
jgi:hypothetical protein